EIDVWATGSPVYATTLYDAAGVVLGSSYYANNHIYYAAAPGTYFVRVSTYSSTGAYALEVRTTADDHGNSLVTATALTVGGTAVNGAIEFTNDGDYFAVQLTAGNTLDVWTTGTLDTMGTLYDASGWSLATNADGGGTYGTNFHLSYAVTITGTYYVRVSANSLGAYAVQATQSVTPALPADANGNSIGTATLIAATSSTAASIDYAGDYDYFRIDVVSAGTLDLSTSSAIDTYGYLFNSTGTQLTYQDDGGGTYGLNFHMSYAVTPGTYYVAVRHYYSTGTGAYTLISKLQ
ncbi:MAG: PPC domain-containing protein, partial [Gammaproteobacteria bacterium]|nr:PPC domain-containing protein [Gammaproteobacteria bacterium]